MVVEFLQLLISSTPGPAVAMPIPGSFPLSENQVRGFGLSGNSGTRRLSTSLEIQPGPAGTIPLVAMFEGEISWVGDKVALDPVRRDGTYFVTARAGLLLKVSPVVGFRRAMSGNPDYPLELPVPFWVVYEGATPEVSLLDQGAIERYEVLDSFAFNSDTLPPGHQILLDDLAADLLLDTSLKARLEGHTDLEGDSAFNLDLGIRRALALSRYLESKGLDPQRMIVNTFGETRLRALNPPDRDAAAVNRRVEIHLVSSADVQVRAGADIGSADNGVKITMLDPSGYWLDPLELALRLRPDLDTHPLAALHDPLSPVISSGTVRCVSPNPVNDGAADQGATFSFHGSLGEAIANAEEADTVWICTGYAPAFVDLGTLGGLLIDCPMSIVGKPDTNTARPRILKSGDGTPLIKLVPPAERGEYGVRILGITGYNEQIYTGAAIEAQGVRNVHIGRCEFIGFQSDGDGGAVSFHNCRKVLIEDCSFRLNSARKGGAIFAEDCRELVITGAPCPNLDSLLVSEDLLPATFLPDSIPGAVPGVPEALGGIGFDSLFINQGATEGGGAVALLNCSFRISHTYFVNNSAGGDGYGGAVGIQLFDSSLEAVENSVERCVFAANSANDGGGICAVGRFDDKRTRAGLLHVVVGGGHVRIHENAIHGNSAIRSGGGLHLLPGHYYVGRNRIAQNSAFRNGGGITCLGRCNAELDGNLILHNKMDRKDTDEPPGGGAGIYATFFTGQDHTTITLRNNRVIANQSTEDGGGLRATCGTRVILEGGNLFKDNIAFLNGGAISTNDAHLTIGPSNRFESNKTKPGPAGYHQGGDGGAIYCAGDFPSSGPLRNFFFGACVSDGSLLDISGSPSDKVSFVGNEAMQHGAAIYVFQQVDINFPNFIGTLRRVVIQNCDFNENRSLEELIVGAEHYSGSALVLDGLTRWLHLLNHGFGDFYVLRDLSLTLAQGVGVYLLNSAEVERTNVTVQVTPGSITIRDELIINR